VHGTTTSARLSGASPRGRLVVLAVEVRLRDRCGAWSVTLDPHLELTSSCPSELGARIGVVDTREHSARRRRQETRSLSTGLTSASVGCTSSSNRSATRSAVETSDTRPSRARVATRGEPGRDCPNLLCETWRSASRKIVAEHQDEVVAARRHSDVCKPNPSSRSSCNWSWRNNSIRKSAVPRSVELDRDSPRSTEAVLLQRSAKTATMTSGTRGLSPHGWS